MILEKVMKRVQIQLHSELHFTKDMIKRKLECAGYVLRGFSDLRLQVLEGRARRVEGKRMWTVQ